MTEPREHPVDEADPMDRRLRAAAGRWRAGQPAAPLLDVATLQPPRRHRRRALVPLAAAAAVAAVVVAGVVGLPRPDHPVPQQPFVTGPTPDVPWRDLPATHPRLRSVTRAPDAASLVGVPRCADGDLTVHSDGQDGAMGTTYNALTFRLAGSQPCVLEGTPHVVVHTVEGDAVDSDLGGHHYPALRGYRGPVLVTPASPARASFAWPSMCHSERGTQSRVDVSIPGGQQTTSLTGYDLGTRCTQDYYRHYTPQSLLGVYAFEPVEPDPRRVVTPFDGLVVDGDLDQQARPGEVIGFTITLTATHRTSLARCPDYTLQLGQGEAQHRGLNCSDVPFRDSRGRPYLPADRPVSFAMEATIPTGISGEQKLLWTLDGPESAPGVNGVVTVTP